MTTPVTVRTGGRLHFGLLAIDPPRGRHFGGAGLMVDEPGFALSARVSHADSIQGAEPAITRRITEFLQRLRTVTTTVEGAADHSPVFAPCPPLAITVQRAIAPHLGLGSGTQLGLAVATLANHLTGWQQSLETLASWTLRGRRSAIGLHGFREGGFLVEGGKRTPQDLSPLVARCDWPLDWPLVLVTPPQTEGLSGTPEQQAFARLAPMTEALTARLCRTLLMDLLPALHDHDFTAVSAALFEYGRLVGEYFAPVQGGTFADRRVARLVDHLRREGHTGIAQTSWGPTVAVVCPTHAAADDLAKTLRRSGPWVDFLVQIVHGRNRGAAIEVIPHDA